ncbi:MAG TPA: hypothetical protein VGU20_26030 [Stellaceae bacterium]|nr:hypothetical protein [Stellaceae bacterium]
MIAVAELGAPITGASLDHVPRMRPAKARRAIMTAAPTASAANHANELLPRFCASIALERSGEKPDRKLAAGLYMDTVHAIQGFVVVGREHEITAKVDEIRTRARQLVTWRWHAIQRVAQALLISRSITGAETAALIA